MTGSSDPDDDRSHDRLNGWKPIAVYLGRSVRTAHRWEAELALPVHRLQTPSGEIVWASRTEIEAWLQASERHRAQLAEADEPENAHHGNGLPIATPTPAVAGARLAAPAATLPLRGAAGVAVLVAVVFALGWVARGVLARRHDAAGATGRPAQWRVAGDQLLVYDDAHHLLWTHSFGTRLNESAYTSTNALAERLVAIEDLDGDARPEVAFVALTNLAAHNRLYCFDADGRVRFEHQPARSLVFGHRSYEPPFGVTRLLVTAEPGGQKAIWIVVPHNLLFPTGVQKIGPHGELLGEYWNDGHLATQLYEAKVAGRHVVLAGGTNNELWGGTLLVLDQSSPTGFTPAINSDYRCASCPAGEPMAAFVFPRMELSRLAESRPVVREIRVLSGGGVMVTVFYNVTVPGEATTLAPVLYTFDDRLRLVGAEMGDVYAMTHAKLELLGRLDHRFGARDERDLFPVLEWSGGKLRRLEAVDAAALAASTHHMASR